ncbi:MAG: hypothetical protein V1872_13250 [bacterium]
MIRFQNGYAQYVKENGHNFQDINEGVWGHVDEHHHFYWIDLRIIGQRDPESFINLFCSNYKKYAKTNKPIQIRHFGILDYIRQSIFKKEVRMTNTEIRQLPEFTTSIEIMEEKLLASIPIEKRLKGLKPKERLEGLKPEERLEGLKPKERLEGLKPEERLEGLTTKELKR